MSKQTVLEVTNAALNSIGSDSVDSINDTPEALDVANMARDVYFDIIHSRKWPHLRTILNPTEATGSTTPTYMTLPDTIQDIDVDTMYYDKKVQASDPPNYELVTYCHPDNFLKIVMSRSDSKDESNVDEITDSEGFKIYVYNDRAPSWFTSFNDATLVFDAYDSNLETKLQNSKAQVVAYKEPTFSVSDSHTPDLPSKAFPYYIAELKSVVAVEIAQEANPKQESISREHRSFSAIEKSRSNRDGIRTPHFGRK